jgi:hypothetical protein
MDLFFSNDITSWRGFAKEVRSKQLKLLVNLENFPNSILVTGCQRSGGTILAQVITQSNGIVNQRVGRDAELDSALILSGHMQQAINGRCCFQTTFLNERYHEYFEHPTHKIIWVLRNPHSVVYSMLYHWANFALNELFLQCGYAQMDYRDRIRFQRFGIFGVPRIRRAAYAYNGKVTQLFKLKQNYPSENINVVEYDDLVNDKMRIFPLLYSEIDLIYREEYIDPISQRSLSKKDKLSQAEVHSIDAICMPIYQDARMEITLK